MLRMQTAEYHIYAQYRHRVAGAAQTAYDKTHQRKTYRS